MYLNLIKNNHYSTSQLSNYKLTLTKLFVIKISESKYKFLFQILNGKRWERGKVRERKKERERAIIFNNGKFIFD